MPTVEYKSAKGHFLTWDEWMRANATQEELAIYADDAMTPEKLSLYQRWMTEEQIIEHKFIDDDGNIEYYPI